MKIENLNSLIKTLVLAVTLLFPSLGHAGEYFLTIDEMPFSPSGKQRTAIALNGSVPGPTLRWKEGETVTIHVTNNLDEDASIHWHGILVPEDMDGVPGISFAGIKPSETFTYTFTIKQYGTYWYHSHSDLQEQQGVYGALIIDPIKPDPFGYERDQVIFLSDWTDEKPKKVLANLKKRSDYYNYNKKTVGDFFKDAKKNGLGATIKDRAAWGRMRMDPTDIADVTGYTFLMNGLAPDENFWAGFKPGEKIRLRLINGSAMTFFDLRIPGLKMTVVQADGQNVQPVPVDEIRIAVAETYDVIVEPTKEVYTIFAEAMDRSGYALGTLSVKESMKAPIPEMQPRPERTMMDMPGMADMEMDGLEMEDMDISEMKMESMPKGDKTEIPTGKMEGMEGMSMEKPMNMQDDMMKEGYRVLKYEDLISYDPLPDKRPPEREIIIRLTGNMERYIWTINGKRLQDADPIHLKFGERVRFTFVNETMMDHPMHLHGMWMELVNAMGMPAARKHTVSVAPARTVSVDVTADALGTWAFHCHLLYHMKAGMFTTVIVSENGEG